MSQPLSIDQRKFDWFYVVVLCIFSLFSFFGDSTPATGGPDPHSGWIMKRLIHDIYAMNKDPLVLYSPVFVRVACFFAAFIFGPFQLVAAWAILIHILDIFYVVRPMVYPGQTDAIGLPGLWIDAAAIIGVVALWASFLIRRVCAGVLVPTHDPRIAEAIHHRNYV